MNEQVTTVKVDRELYEKFKIENIKKKFGLQDLVSKSMHLYLTDASFRDKIFNHNIPKLSDDANKVTLNITGSKGVVE